MGQQVDAVLDTSVIIAIDVPPLAGKLAVSVATFAELHFGVLVARRDEIRAERLARLSFLQTRFSPLPIDDAVASSYGRLAAAVAAIGRKPRARTMDLLIAATAHANRARLYTRNPNDFNGLEDLLEVVAT